MKKALIIILSTSLVVLALIGISLLLFGEFDGNKDFEIMFTTLAFSGVSRTAFANASFYEKTKIRLLPLAGIIISLFGFVITVNFLWNVVHLSVDYVSFMFVSSILAVST